ncbi:MAG: serine hydrolase [Flavobacteriaceae bacterium]|nr:serine hydrolase [Flavobacteriaceae bacterium]
MKTKKYSRAILIFTCLFLLVNSITAQNLKSNVDAIIAQDYLKDAPGISILIAKNGKTIYTNATGLANMELEVPLSSNSVFEIGSITKQFTSISILMLEEQGKLSITDNITKYIPDYPTHGKTITIHHLLNHTSGIKSYTAMQSFVSQARKDMTPTELIDVFKDEPMDFDPGEKFRYNNSGYILLGHIIEVITKNSYADFIEKNIFEPVGMTSSYYGSMKKIIPNRASGYSKRNNNIVNADYLSLTLPYAAGSIMSTVGDLLKWQNALNANQLIKRSSLEKAIHGSTLNNGEKINYGYGLIASNLNGSQTIEHSGGIFGYSTNGIYLPKEDVYVIGLTNCDCSNAKQIVSKVAATVIGKPFYNKKDAITLNETQLKKWVGSYQFDENVIRFVTIKDGKIYSQREGSDKLEIHPMSESTFMFDGSTTSYKFAMKNGKKEATMTTNGKKTIGKEINKGAPAEKKEITLSGEILQQYVGTYELAPTFSIKISVRESRIFGVATGQPEVELFPHSKNAFFLKVVKAEIIFDRNELGKVTQLTLHQNGQKMPGKKVE